MSLHRFAQKQFWISVLVLVSLFAQILPTPARPVSAQTLSCAGGGLRSVQIAAVPDAEQDVEIPKEIVDLAIWNANWRDRLTDASFVESLLLSALITEAAKYSTGDFEATIATYVEIYSPVLDALSEIQDTDQHDWLIHTMLNVALDMPEMAPAVPFVWKELTTNDLWIEQDLNDQIGRSALRYNLTDSLLDRSSAIMARVYACAKEIPEVAHAFDQYHSHQLISSIIDGFDKVIADNPDLPIPAALLAGIGDDGTLEISLADLKAMSEAEFEKIHASIDDIQEALSEIDKQQKVILDYIEDQELKAKWQELMKKKAAEQELKLNAVKSSISIITLIAGQIDPEFAKGFSVVANSSLKVGLALNSWLKAVSGLKGFDKITSLSTIVMTGNVLGAVMNVVSLFGDGEPTPEELILEEIGKLRQQVDQLRTEMHSRFDRIDQQLNAIYLSMHQRFDQIDVQLGKLNGNIIEVQQALLTIDLKLSRIEQNNYEFLNALGRRPLLDAINGGLGYEDRTGSAMPYQPDFVGFENVLHSWATIHAFDPLNAGPVQRDYSDSQVMAELSAYPLDSNLNYLNGWLVVNGLPAIADKRLPSPRDWLFASRAYAQLGLEWPEHMRRIGAQRQDALDKVGIDLEEAMRNISTVQTPAGPIGNTLLFTTVITHYQGKIDSLDSSLQGMEEDFMAEVESGLRPGKPFDLYGGIDQTLTFQTEGFQKMYYGNLIQTLPAPSNLSIPNYNVYNLADYFQILGGEKSRVTVAGDLILSRLPPPGCPPNCPLTGDLEISVTATYSDVSVLDMRMMAGRVTLQLGTDPTEYVVANWGSLKPRFETEALPVPPTPELISERAALLAEVSSQLEERLELYQQALYGRILNELSIGSLKSLAVETAGSKALVDSFVTLGLPRAVAKDEFFHAMLFGNQQLIDDGEVLQSYAISATQPITGVHLLVNPRVVLKETADRRRSAFAEMINTYLDAITAQTHVEGPDYIANTRSILNLTMRIVQIEAPAPTPTPTATATATATATTTPAATATSTPEGGVTVSGMLFEDTNGSGSLDDGEAGIGGATVTLTEADRSAAQVRTAVTDAGGVYTFTGIPPGQYTLAVALPSGQGGDIPPRTVTVDGSSPVTVPPTAIQVRNLVYLPTLQRSPAVQRETSEGATGTPLYLPSVHP